MFSIRSIIGSLALYSVLMFWCVGTVFAAADSVVTVTGITLSGPGGVAASATDIFIADTGHNQITNKDATIVIGDGTAGYLDGAAGSAQFNAPVGLAVDKSGNIYIADTGNNVIRKYTASTGTVSTVVGNRTAGYAGDGKNALLAELNGPTGVAVDPDGVLYIADKGNYRIRKVDASNTITTFTGNGNPATLTAYGVALAPLPLGDLYIADSGNNRILKIAATSGALDSKTAPLVFAGTGVAGHSGDGGLATLAKLNLPSAIAINGADLYVSDTMNSCIRKVNLATNVISTRAGSVAQNAAVTAALAYPNGVALDASANLFVADSGNNFLKEVTASTSAITSISPVGGIYTQDQTIILTSSEPAIIYYTTDGTNPLISASRLNYNDPITGTGSFTISGNTTIKYASTNTSGSNPEVVNVVTYVINTTAPTTTASPVAGTYYSAQTAFPVTLSTGDVTDVIYYTKDGISPTVTSTKYSSAVSIPVTSTSTTTNLQFFAMNTFGNKETVKSQKYTIVALATTASPIGGLYASAKDVTLTANDSSATIYYTTDGTPPTTSSTSFNPVNPIHISANTTLKYFAVDSNGFNETVKSQVYTFDSVVPVTTAAPLGGFFTATQSVTLTANDPTASIYYSTSGTAPTVSTATKYTSGSTISISKTTTLMFFAVDPAGNKESVKTQVYTIDSTAPSTTASIQTGTFASAQTVTLTTNDTTATIYYTLDGSPPTTASPSYGGVPIAINKTTTLKYYAVDTAGNAETVKTQTYTIINLTTIASPVSGTFSATQTVTLAANESGATIYYTLDGKTPTTSSKKYTAPFLISETTTAGSTTTVLQFFAVDKAGVVESVKSEIYAIDSIVPATTVKCVVNAVAPLNTVKLTAVDSADPAPAIKYLLYGGTLTSYSAPFAITSDTIVKFFAVDAAGNTEQIKTGYCPIDSANPKPALYLETLATGATTSNNTLYLRGNVAPFKTTTLTVQLNGGALVTVTPSTIDGSFTHTVTLAAGANTVSIVATDSATSLSTPADSRTINYITPGTTPTVVTIGASNAVKGNAVKLPITFAGGYQAAAVSIDVGYSTAQLSIPSASIAPAAAAAGKVISTGTPSAGVFRILITDALGSSITPVPDGEIATISFGVSSSGSGSVTLTNTPSAADLATPTPNSLLPSGVVGTVEIVAYPGDSDGNGTVTLPEVLAALRMLVDPVANPVDGAMDLNGDGVVSISELQQVINTFLEF